MMAEEKTTQADVLDAVVGALNEAAERAWQSPPKRLATLLERLTAAPALPIHPSRRGEVAEQISVAHPRIVGALARGDEQGFKTEMGNLADAIRSGGYGNPKAEPDERERCLRIAQMYGWGNHNGRELDLLRGMVKPGDKVEYLDWWTVRISGRTYSRRDVRLSGKPAWWKSDEDEHFLASFGQIPSREEVAFQAERDPAIAERLRWATEAR